MKRETLDGKRLFKALNNLPEYSTRELDMQFCAEVLCRSMDAAEYHRLKDEALAEYRRKLDAIETVWRMSNNQGAPPEQPSTSELIKRVLPSFAEKAFTVVEVKEAIERMFPDMKGRIRLTSISGTFTRMAKRADAIRIQHKGSGTIGTTYVRLPESSKGTV
jgi:hypothetical protein